MQGLLSALTDLLMFDPERSHSSLVQSLRVLLMGEAVANDSLVNLKELCNGANWTHVLDGRLVPVNGFKLELARVYHPCYHGEQLLHTLVSRDNTNNQQC
jgi:hypothetical protein